MGTVEDIRQAFQDFLAPELRTITARLEALAQVMDARFAAVDQRFAAIEQRMDTRFDAVTKEFAQVRELLDINRRLEKLESKQAPATQ